MIALLTSLPTSLSCAIVSDWLDNKSIVQLDTAHCSNLTRQPLLDIYAHRECIVQSHYCRFDARTVKWLTLRKIKFAKIGIEGIRGADCEAYLAEHGHLVRSLQVDTSGMSSEDMTTVSKHCRNLTKLYGHISEEGVDCHDILVANPRLGYVSIMMGEIGEGERISPQYSLPNLHTFHIQCIQTLAFDLCMAIVTGAPSLVRLVINGRSTTEDRLLQILRLCPHLRSVRFPAVEHVDEMLVEAVVLCPQIVNIDMSGCLHLTDEGVRTVAQSLKGLRSIAVYSSSQLSNDMLKHLADHASRTLEQVYVFAVAHCTLEDGIQDGSNFSKSAIAYLHVKCPHLKAFKFSVLQTEQTESNVIPTTHMCTQATALMLTAASTKLFDKIALRCERLNALSLTFVEPEPSPIPEREIIKVVESCAALRVVYVPSPRVAAVRELLAQYSHVQVLEETKGFYYDALVMPVD